MIYKKNTKVSDRLRLIIVIIQAILMILAATGLIYFIVQTVNRKHIDNTTTSAYANRVKESAIKALNENSKPVARVLFTNAHKLYEELGDKDNIIYTETQLKLLED